MKNHADLLRKSIIRCYELSKNNNPWPPTADELSSLSSDILPVALIEFLTTLISGQKPTESTNRLIFSIRQDIGRAVTNGEWKLPKHIFLTMTLRHLSRNKQLTTILNRCGHCESYDYSLQLETALAIVLEQTYSIHSPNILCGDNNKIFHCEWDNLNKITTGVHGPNIVNSAAGIMIQEINPPSETRQCVRPRVLPTIEKTKLRSLHIDVPSSLQPLHFSRVSPHFPERYMSTERPENLISMRLSLLEYYIWQLSRYLQQGDQQIPPFGGFISATGRSPERKSTIEYFTPIHQPITDNSVVYELLKRTQMATDEVGRLVSIMLSTHLI